MTLVSTNTERTRSVLRHQHSRHFGGESLQHDAGRAAGQPQAGSRLKLAVEAGTFCVQVYDVGAVEQALSFEVTIERL